MDTQQCRLERIVFLHLCLLIPTLLPYPNLARLTLQYNGSGVPCVGPTDHNSYCLSGIFLSNRDYECYLDNELVYKCTTEDVCTDHGRLEKNIRPSELAKECVGIPFANIKPEAVGNYTCISETNGHRTEAQYLIDYCKAPTVELGLEFQGKPARCITISNHDKFCLTLKLDGKPAQGRAFKIYFKENLIYNCKANGTCKDHGIFKGNTRPPEAAGECFGLPFANVWSDLTGEYTTTIENKIHLFEAKNTLHFCNDITELKLKLYRGSAEADCIDVKSTDLGNYCLTVGEKTGYIHDFQCFLNDELIYTCTEPDSCKEDGIWNASDGLDGKHIIPKSIAKDCSGIPFANLDKSRLGKYSCRVETRNGSWVTGHFNIKECPIKFNCNKIDECPSVKTTTKNITTDWGLIGTVIVIAILVSFVAAIKGFCCCRKKFTKSCKKHEKDIDELESLKGSTDMETQKKGSTKELLPLENKQSIFSFISQEINEVPNQ